MSSGKPKKGQEKKLYNKIKKNGKNGDQDREAFIEAYDLYVDQIYRFIYFKVSSSDEAHDLTSAVFLKTWNYIQTNSLKDVNTLRALIYKIARTSVIDHYRKNYQVDSIDDKERKIDIPDSRQDILRQVEISSDLEIIEKKLRELKYEYREVIILRFIDELTIKEIAEIVDKTKTNTRVLLHRATKSLKELMKDKI